MMKPVLVVIAVGLSNFSSATFACSQKELAKKASDLQVTMTTYIQNNREKSQEVITKANLITAKADSTRNIDDVCKAYDELLASMK